jgi:uncharacterized membrane protein
MHSVADIDWLAVIVSSVTAFVLGALWYGPFFSTRWMREMGVDRSFKPRMNRGLLFSVTLALIFLAAIAFGVLIGPRPGLRIALQTAAVIGFLWVGASMTIAYMFAGRSLTLAFIDAGYAAAQFVLFGLVFYLL